MIFKVCGCFFVLAATTFAGMARAECIKEQYRQMRMLQRIICMVESEIRYAHTHLGEKIGRAHV